ncbi:hypothetical protein [Rathayibacter sp. VKM Ac-2927]|uniref:hypothetical protein n=1 Tax=Rathayibacter sp. VKM Ac-2927 TaxID=2929478 RepID=UPI001FB24019|nr:hypothetical protein [Rathayibacter sp. VKM Ac-2927]MCJ1688548.1 hypothetical protein [Rathayibacter sp. VKM Ac-2927]
MTTAIGVILLLAAAWLGSVTLEVGGRMVTVVTGGFVDLVGRSYEGPAVITAGLVALAWLLMAIAALHRGRRWSSLVIAVGGAASAWTTDQLAWSVLAAPVDGRTPVTFILLSAVALAAPLAAVIAAVHAVILEPAAQWVIGAATTAPIAGAWILVSLGQPTSVAEALVHIGSALALPVSLAITGGSIAFHGVGIQEHVRTDASNRRTSLLPSA